MRLFILGLFIACQKYFKVCCNRHSLDVIVIFSTLKWSPSNRRGPGSAGRRHHLFPRAQQRFFPFPHVIHCHQTVRGTLTEARVSTGGLRIQKLFAIKFSYPCCSETFAEVTSNYVVRTYARTKQERQFLCQLLVRY